MEKTIRKVRAFVSLRKEMHWLEEMAQKGYFLTDLSMGFIYSFRQDTPQHLVYEVDRFDLPKSPSLKEIQEKEMFLSLAEEMGWQEVTHDEDMNYYFCKPYEEDGINEMYNDDEMRTARAAKFRDHYQRTGRQLGMTMICWLFVLFLLSLGSSHPLASTICFLLAVITVAGEMFVYHMSEFFYQEFSLNPQEWERIYGSGVNVRKKRRLFLTTHGLEKYLHRQSLQGWHLTKNHAITYYFEKADTKEYYYTVDSRKAVNRRRKAQKQRAISDRKDINQQNNDWQVQSVQDAQRLGLKFTSAYGNNQVIYRSERPASLEGKTRFLYSWLIYWIVFFGISFMVGYLSGAAMAFI